MLTSSSLNMKMNEKPSVFEDRPTRMARGYDRLNRYDLFILEKQ